MFLRSAFKSFLFCDFVPVARRLEVERLCVFLLFLEAEAIIDCVVEPKPSFRSGPWSAPEDLEISDWTWSPFCSPSEDASVSFVMIRKEMLEVLAELKQIQTESYLWKPSSRTPGDSSFVFRLSPFSIVEASLVQSRKYGGW